MVDFNKLMQDAIKSKAEQTDDYKTAFQQNAMLDGLNLAAMTEGWAVESCSNLLSVMELVLARRGLQANHVQFVCTFAMVTVVKLMTAQVYSNTGHKMFFHDRHKAGDNGEELSFNEALLEDISDAIIEGVQKAEEIIMSDPVLARKFMEANKQREGK